MTAEEAYGGDPALRAWLEGRGLWHVMAVKCTELVAIAGPAGPVRMAAEQLAFYACYGPAATPLGRAGLGRGDPLGGRGGL